MVEMTFRRVLWTIVILSSLMSTVFLGYTLDLFSKIYVAVRMVNIKVDEFNLNVTDNNATIKILTTILNPTEFTFRWIRLTQKIYLNGEFFLISRKEIAELPASMNITITFNLDVPFYKVDLIRGPNKKYWDIIYYIWFKVPVIESTYNLHFRKRIIIN